jgi:hypothetical protein
LSRMRSWRRSVSPLATSAVVTFANALAVGE